MSGNQKNPKPEQKNAKAFHDLHQAEAKYRSTIENAVEGIYQSTPGGRFLSVNPAMARIFGYDTPGEMIAAVIDITHQVYADPKMRREFARRLKKEGKVEKFEARALRKDGSLIWISTNARIMRDAKGKALFYEGFIQDITERKQVEEALRESEVRYHALFENINSGVAVYEVKDNGQDFIFKDFNRAGEKMDQEQRERLIGKSIFDVRPGVEQFGLIDVFRKVWKTGKPAYHPITLYQDKRLTGWYENYIYKLPSGEIVAVFENITERKRSEEALHQQYELVNRIAETSPAGITVVDREGEITFANTRAEQVLGLTKDRITQRTYNSPEWRITDHDGNPFPEEELPFRRVMASTQPVYDVYHAIEWGDGRRVLLSINAAPLLDATGNVSAVVATVEDITERKRAEEALRENRARLARLSRSLVQAQEEERLRIARELHDEVGQTLTALTISLEGVSRLVKEAAPRSKIVEIQALARNLINQVSALSLELRPTLLDDLGLIPGLIALFSRFSAQTGAGIDFKHTGLERNRLTPEIEITAYRIIQEALTNVVRHAGVKTASVRLQVEGDILYIQVQDEGKGFDLQKALSAEGSLGLLSMTERAGQVGGRLEVLTAPGEGALITCQLPLGGGRIERRENERNERDENRPGR